MKKRYKLTTYLAGAIEHTDKDQMVTWREQFRKSFSPHDLLIYDPVLQESVKVGLPPGEHNKYIRNLKKAGHYEHFYDEMWKIWFGDIDKNTDINEVLSFLRNRKLIDGNYREEYILWGDAEAVVRSDFIVAFLPKNVKTIGTIFEIVFAFLFRIPVFLVLPDQTKTSVNSSLLFGIMISGGEVFYSMKDCIKYIKKVYKI